MDLDYSADEQSFRAEARSWLKANAPDGPKPAGDSPAAAAFDRAWQRRLYDGGWAGVNWPKEYGGRGLTSIEQMIWLEECARAGVNIGSSNTVNMGLAMVGPTLILRGTEEQQRRFLPPILKGEHVWCQGFSEAGAGTDLAAVRTRGHFDGDHIVINGQKMWTSKAQHGDYHVLLIRTDRESSGHRGLSYVICDLHAPGITLQPVKLMTGENTVNMLFYDDVRVPIENLVGEAGQGWSVAMATLMLERGIAQYPDLLLASERLDALIGLAREARLESGRLAIDDDEIRRRLARLKADILAIRSMTIANMSAIARDGQPGPGDSSIMKLYIGSTFKKIMELSEEIIGWQFYEYGEDRTSNRWTYDFMWSWALTVAGGSNEILHDIIADRMLQLPRAR